MTVLCRYATRFPLFEGSQEHKLLEALTSAFVKDNVDGFTEAAFKFNRVMKLNRLQNSLLAQIKIILRDGNKDDGKEVDQDDWT